MQSKGFVSGGREAMRDAGIPPIDEPYESAHYDRWFDFITKEDYQRYGIEHGAFNEIASITMHELEEQTGFELGHMDVAYNYQRGTNGYAVVDPSGPFFVHIDQSLDMQLFGLTLAMVTWMRDYDNDPGDLFFFRQVLYCMNELFVLGNLPGNEMRTRLFDRVASDMQILDLASDLYWAMLAFTMGHEFGHAYQMASAPGFWGKRRHGSEYHADSLGYRVLLGLIRKGCVGSFQFEPYTCLAPMMYLGYYQMARETDRVLYGVYGEPATHPTLAHRKNALFKTADRLWLLSIPEVYGRLSVQSQNVPPSPATYDAEGTQYKLYADRGVTTTNYAPCAKDGASSWWWLRSPSASVTYRFLLVNDVGDWIVDHATIEWGVSPGFCF